MSNSSSQCRVGKFLLSCFLFLKAVTTSVPWSGWRRQFSILLLPEHPGSWRLGAVIAHEQLDESNGIYERVCAWKERLEVLQD